MMKRYKLLKDLPTFKAGQLAYISKQGNLMAGMPENQKTTETCSIIMIYHETTLKKFPEILTEWFEEIQEEPIDSIHWRPEIDDYFWCINTDGEIIERRWRNNEFDKIRYKLGRVYKTRQECEKAKERKLAKARLQRTSTFRPDFENDKGGWVVCYYHVSKELDCIKTYRCDSGEPVRYATREDALKSIKENERDWLIYFGIEEEI